MAEQLNDRRGFVRIPFNTETMVQAGEQTIRASAGIDVSMSGIRLPTADNVPTEGTTCRVTISLKASDHRVFIEARGEVIRSEPGSLAVRFTEVDLDSYQHLRQLILHNTEEPERAEQQFRSHWGIRRPS